MCWVQNTLHILGNAHAEFQDNPSKVHLQLGCLANLVHGFVGKLKAKSMALMFETCKILWHTHAPYPGQFGSLVWGGGSHPCAWFTRFGEWCYTCPNKLSVHMMKFSPLLAAQHAIIHAHLAPKLHGSLEHSMPSF